MAYKIEGTDILINGFEQGIADTPYEGIADMRNTEIISYPKEASVAFSMSSITLPPAITGMSYTAQNSGDTITVASTTGLVPATAIFFVSTTATGITINKVYYVGNITATTFQLWLMPALQGTPVAITGDGSGTFTVYQYGNQRAQSGTAYAPVSYFRVSSVAENPGLTMSAGILLTDWSNYVWFMPRSANSTSGGTVPANTPVFLGNISGVGAASGGASAIALWQGYIFLIGASGIDVANANSLWFTNGPAVAWSYSWDTNGLGTSSVNGRGAVIVSQEDENLYWGGSLGLNSLIETPGDTFDSTDPTSYTLNAPAIALIGTEKITAVAELGKNLLIGTIGSFMYVWDKLSPGYNDLINIPDPYITMILATNQNAYVFAGNRGRIYITNGSGIDLYKKIPDYITGLVSPYIRWRSAYAEKNQIYFTFQALTNASVASDTVAGIWAIDLGSDALRLIAKLTNSGYGGTPAMVIAVAPTSSLQIPAGNGLITGWLSGSTYGLDAPSSDPYTNYETFIDTDMIPVGTYLKPFTPSQIEWKTSVPLVSGEGIKISYRTNLTSSFTQIGESTTAGALSDFYKTNFQKVQWAQFRIETKSTLTTPTLTRLTEIRVRDLPSA